MGEPVYLSSSENPRIKAVLKLREHRHRRQTGLFIAEGDRQVDRALRAGLVLRELYLLAGAAMPQPMPAEAAVFHVSEKLLKKMAYRAQPQAVLAVFEQPRWSLEQLPAKAADDELWLVAVAIEKPGNLGAIARSAAGAGATGLLVADVVVDPFNPNAIFASTGAVFELPIIGESSAVLIDALKARGCRIIAATPAGGELYTEADLSGPVALVIGPEDTGLGPPWLQAAGSCIRIDLAEGAVDSLNAAAAAAVCLFEAVRQRRS